MKVFAFSNPSGSTINEDAELARLEFKVIGKAGDKSGIDIQGILGNSEVEPIEVAVMFLSYFVPSYYLRPGYYAITVSYPQSHTVIASYCHYLANNCSLVFGFKFKYVINSPGRIRTDVTRSRASDD